MPPHSNFKFKNTIQGKSSDLAYITYKVTIKCIPYEQGVHAREKTYTKSLTIFFTIGLHM